VTPKACSEDHEDWLPNHLLVIHVILVFAIINPLVTPFALVYFMVETGRGSSV